MRSDYKLRDPSKLTFTQLDQRNHIINTDNGVILLIPVFLPGLLNPQ